MLTLQRAEENPLISPRKEQTWESKATFNPSVVYDDTMYHMVYRAQSEKMLHQQQEMELSSIGYAKSNDGIHFTERKQLIMPDTDWDQYGCEDPRITKIDDTYFIFYTALSTFPFSPGGIRVGLAITKNFDTLEAKHSITPFNAKAMCLFPEKINGSYVALLTVDTDQPPAKVALATFDRLDELWSVSYWQNWYAYLDDHRLDLGTLPDEYVEVGAPPVHTNKGWLLLYSRINAYFSDKKKFTISSVMLRSTNPLSVTASSPEPLLTPELPYEKVGNVSDVVFPSGAVTTGDLLSVYYSGADTVSCVATCSLSALKREMIEKRVELTTSLDHQQGTVMLKRFEENPVLTPTTNDKALLHPTVLVDAKSVFLLFESISYENTVSFNSIVESDGFHFTDKQQTKVFFPPSGQQPSNPQLTIIDSTVYLTYTVTSQEGETIGMLSSVSITEFRERKWLWTVPCQITDKMLGSACTCLFPQKNADSYLFLSNRAESIWLDRKADLYFTNTSYLLGKQILSPRPDKWDRIRVGIAGSPIAVPEGWLLLYQGTDPVNRTSLGIALLDTEQPEHLIARLDYPLLSPEASYETKGNIPNHLSSGGALILDNHLVVYYGAAQSSIAVATISLPSLLDELKRFQI